MNKQEAVKILAILTAAYPNAYKHMTPDEANGVVAIWAIQFADVPADIVFMALNKAISGCKFPPSIAEIKGRISSLHWEAYEAMNAKCIVSEPNDEYKRIYEATMPYRVTSMEISLDNMLGSGAQKLLGYKEV